MKWQIEFPLTPIDRPADYQDKIMLVGSCFAENIGMFLDLYKLKPLVNPHGILYNPASIAQTLQAYLEGKRYAQEDLFYDHGLWHSWEHHERFSGSDRTVSVNTMNGSAEQGGNFLSEADWLIVTLGTAGIYRLKSENRVVANCHKRPASDFDFVMMTPQEVMAALDSIIHRLFFRNTKLKIIFTVSPVRYLRYGLTENNLSKAVLLYAVHHLVNKYERLYYFPAYEIVVDELRDYRFYAEDLVHPSEQALRYVWDKFARYFLSRDAHKLMEEIHPVLQAARHRPLHVDSGEYKKFVHWQTEKIAALEMQYPFLDFEKEKNEFSR